MDYIMKLECMSRHEIERANIAEKHLKIVIHDPNSTKPQISYDNCIDALFLEFDDASYESEFDIVFKKTDAKAISCLVKKHEDLIDGIYVSCEKGVSRSAGVVAALDEYFNCAESKLFYDTSKFPNMLVYERLSLYLENEKN